MKTGYLVLILACLVSCSPTLPTYDVKFSGNTIQVPTTGFDNSSFNVVHDPNAAFDILLIKKSPLAYEAYYLKCTFDQKALDPTPEQIVCPVCASIYDFDGTVKKAPAETGLAKFQTELNADQTLVTINIEALGL